MATAEEWIEKGYEYFGKVGPINFSVKKMSEENSLSRTTFNYHFASQDEFFMELLAFHVQTLDKFLVDAKTEVKKYIPDLYILANNYSILISFQLQLFNHRYNTEFDRVYSLINSRVSIEVIIDKFIDYYHLNLTKLEATEIHEILVDAWFSRLNLDDITIDTMTRKIEDIMKVLVPHLK